MAENKSDCCPRTSGNCESASRKDDLDLKNRMGKVCRKILVLSGKGGVGKSTVAVNLAYALSMKGKKTGLIDVDLHGPSVPGILGLKGKMLGNTADGKIRPMEVNSNLKVVSIGLLLENERDAVIWRGPMKHNVIKQLLKDSEWGELDYLVIDSPPGTGDEPLAVAQLAGAGSSALIVTTPQSVATDDVRRSISFCNELGLEMLGLVENMSGFTCPHCAKDVPLFGSGGGENLAKEMSVPFLGRIPFASEIVTCGEEGSAFVGSSYNGPSLLAFEKILDRICSVDNKVSNLKTKEEQKMKVAIPTADGKLCMHFGHCEEFALVDADAEEKKIMGVTKIVPPPHEPGLLPKWLHEKGATVIIAGGMGQRAQDIFKQNGIKVLVGAPADSPENLVMSYLDGTLKEGQNTCDH